MVLSRNELAQVIADNPFPDEANPKCLHAAFRSEELGPGEVAAVADALQRAREKAAVTRHTAAAISLVPILLMKETAGKPLRGTVAERELAEQST